MPHFRGWLRQCPMTTEQRFWAKVKKTPTCWLWQASKRAKGYGAFAYRRNGSLIQDRAHRYSWEIHRGPIPAGACVLHNCPAGDNPACVNPAHLFLGTKAVNNRDMRAKGRARSGGTKTPVSACNYARGERHHNAKLTAKKAAALRGDRVAGMSYSQLGRKYAINPSAAWKIIKGLLWKPTA